MSNALSHVTNLPSRLGRLFLSINLWPIDLQLAMAQYRMAHIDAALASDEGGQEQAELFHRKSKLQQTISALREEIAANKQFNQGAIT